MKMNGHQRFYAKKVTVVDDQSCKNCRQRRRRRTKPSNTRPASASTGTSSGRMNVALMLPAMIWLVSWIGSVTVILPCDGLVHRRYPYSRSLPVYSLQMTSAEPGPGIEEDVDGSGRDDNPNGSSTTMSELAPTSPSPPLTLSTTTKDPFLASGGGGGGSGGLKSSAKQEEGTELIQTLKGGPALIFELARRSIMFVHDFDDTSIATPNAAQPAIMARKMKRRVLPRWRPIDGVSNSNPKFRKQAPAMTNQGFSKTIWRNARKRNKPQLWRQALRTYDRMAILEQDPDYQQKLKIRRSNIHYEGALVACAKLGLWQRALEIYHCVWQQEQEGQDTLVQPQPEQKATPVPSTTATATRTGKRRVYITDNMILSLVKACVRASRLRSKKKGTGRQKQKDGDTKTNSEVLDAEAALRRIPLDTAQQVLSTMQEDHNIPLMAHFVNPLAAAYQSLGYFQEARNVLQTMLSNRTATEEEPEIGADLLNVHNLWAKDKASYSLMVQGELAAGDYGAAVEALQEMTNAGLYPDKKQTNVWSEISLRQTRPRFVGSRKKKRDDYWTDNIV
mmetsp:Transcript_31045/g.75021  ORF Transcript_31045/g.75021 Transcript_31045/m.75021 type:complete len:562 (-) Transcript_31045:55-1740(-)